MQRCFIQELTATIELWNSNSPLRGISLKMLMILPNLLLQKTSHKTSSSDNKKTLERRLELWRTRNISNLVSESLVLRSRLKNTNQKEGEDMGKSFQKLMLKGKRKWSLALTKGGFPLKRIGRRRSNSCMRISFF